MTTPGPTIVTYRRHDDLVRAITYAACSPYPDAALRLTLPVGYGDARPDQIHAAMQEALPRFEAGLDRHSENADRRMS